MPLNTATGAWTFTADAAELDSLDDDASQVLVLRGQVTDEGGATHAAAFTIVLNGAADPATAALADATSDADGDGVATTFSVTETSSSAATEIATITVTDPDTEYATSDFTISDDDRFEIFKVDNVYTLRIKAGETFTYDAETAANNEFTFTVSGPGLSSTTFTGTILEYVPAANHIFYLADNDDLTAARAQLPGSTDTTAFDGDAGFYILNDEGAVFKALVQAVANLYGSDTVYLGASLHGVTAVVTASGGNDLYRILDSFTAGAAGSQTSTHVTINDLAQPSVNTYQFSSLTTINSHVHNPQAGNLVLTFTNGAKLTIRGVRDDMFVIGDAEAIGYDDFIAAVDAAAATNAPPTLAGTTDAGDLAGAVTEDDGNKNTATGSLTFRDSNDVTADLTITTAAVASVAGSDDTADHAIPPIPAMRRVPSAAPPARCRALTAVSP